MVLLGIPLFDTDGGGLVDCLQPLNTKLVATKASDTHTAAIADAGFLLDSILRELFIILVSAYLYCYYYSVCLFVLLLVSNWGLNLLHQFLSLAKPNAFCISVRCKKNNGKMNCRDLNLESLSCILVDYIQRFYTIFWTFN